MCFDGNRREKEKKTKPGRESGSVLVAFQREFHFLWPTFLSESITVNAICTNTVYNMTTYAVKQGQYNSLILLQAI